VVVQVRQEVETTVA